MADSSDRDPSHSSDAELEDDGLSSSASGSGDDQSEHGLHPTGRDLLDLEASESGDDTGSSPEDEEDKINDFGSPPDFWPSFDFPQFMKLPPELRERIWRFFCPAVDQPYRIFDVILQRDRHAPSGFDVAATPLLFSQLQPVATLRAINHESRAIALRLLPDTLAINGGEATIPFHCERDIVVVNVSDILNYLLDRPFTYLAGDPGANGLCVPGFSERIRHLALDGDKVQPGADLPVYYLFELIASFSNLRELYYMIDHARHSSSEKRWCATGSADVYTFTHTEENEYCEEVEIPFAYARFIPKELPDPEASPPQDPPNLDPEIINVGRVTEDVSGDPDMDEIPDEVWQHMKQFNFWPMMRFVGSSARRLCLKLDRPDDAKDSWDDFSTSGESSDSGVEADDFYDHEDGFIVDDDLEEDTEEEPDDSADEDDLIVHGDGSDGEDEDEEQDGDLAPNGFSPLDQLAGDNEDSVDYPAFGGFSPLEEQSPRDEDNNRVEQEGEQNQDQADSSPQLVVRGRRRRNVLDSDEDDNDDADEDDPQPTTGRRRRNVIDSDDDDDNEDDAAPGDSRPANPAPDLSSEEDGEGEEEDEEEDDDSGGRSKKKLSLAERLQLHREANPVGSDVSYGEDSDEGGGLGGDDDDDDDDRDEGYDEDEDDGGAEVGEYPGEDGEGDGYPEEANEEDEWPGDEDY